MTADITATLQRRTARKRPSLLVEALPCGLGTRAGDARPAGDWRQARSPSPQLVCLLESLDEARALQPSQTQSVLMAARPTLVLTMATVDEFHLSSFFPAPTTIALAPRVLRQGEGRSGSGRAVPSEGLSPREPFF